MNLNEDKLNLSLRSFLKRVGINSQRHIEATVRERAETGEVSARIPVRVRLTIEGVEEDLIIEGEIDTR